MALSSSNRLPGNVRARHSEHDACDEVAQVVDVFGSNLTQDEANGHKQSSPLGEKSAFGEHDGQGRADWYEKC